MYTLIYYVTETKGTEVIEREYHYSDEYRLKRNRQRRAKDNRNTYKSRKN